jgi:hypothetical protein
MSADFNGKGQGACECGEDVHGSACRSCVKNAGWQSPRAVTSVSGTNAWLHLYLIVKNPWMMCMGRSAACVCKNWW